MKIEMDFSNFCLPTEAQFNTATMRALNHTLGKAITAGNKATTEEWNIKTKDLKSYETPKKATTKNLTASLTLKSRSISLAKFQAKQVKKGVSYKLKKLGGRTR